MAVRTWVVLAPLTLGTVGAPGGHPQAQPALWVAAAPRTAHGRGRCLGACVARHRRGRLEPSVQAQEQVTWPHPVLPQLRLPSGPQGRGQWHPPSEAP